MPFGSLDDRELSDEAGEFAQLSAGPRPAAQWVPEAAGVVSPRLRRASEYFAAQEALLHDVR